MPAARNPRTGARDPVAKIPQAWTAPAAANHNLPFTGDTPLPGDVVCQTVSGRTAVNIAATKFGLPIVEKTRMRKLPCSDPVRPIRRKGSNPKYCSTAISARTVPLAARAAMILSCFGSIQCQRRNPAQGSTAIKSSCRETSVPSPAGSDKSTIQIPAPHVAGARDLPPAIGSRRQGEHKSHQDPRGKQPLLGRRKRQCRRRPEGERQKESDGYRDSLLQAGS
jgi:hypothetical protein